MCACEKLFSQFGNNDLERKAGSQEKISFDIDLCVCVLNSNLKCKLYTRGNSLNGFEKKTNLIRKIVQPYLKFTCD